MDRDRSDEVREVTFDLVQLVAPGVVDLIVGRRRESARVLGGSVVAQTVKGSDLHQSPLDRAF